MFAYTITPELVMMAIERIVEAVHPIEIIAFGSRARGDARPDSDLDLLVIVPEVARMDASKFKTRVGLSTLLADIPFAKDILISDPEQMAEEATWPNSIYKNAGKEGLALWRNHIAYPEAVRRICN